MLETCILGRHVTVPAYLEIELGDLHLVYEKRSITNPSTPLTSATSSSSLLSSEEYRTFRGRSVGTRPRMTRSECTRMCPEGVETTMVV